MYPDKDSTAQIAVKPPAPRWRRLGLAAGVVVVAVAAGGAYAAFRTPRWYRPPVISPEERQSVRNNLVGAEQAFTEGLRAMKGVFTYHLFQEDLNRWIAMRREIYPLIDELAPPELAEPFVMFAQDSITIAGRYPVAGISVVVSIDIKTSFEDGAIVLRAGAVRCGSVGVPFDLDRLGLGRPIERRQNKTWPGSPRIWGDLVGGLHIGADAWWKNGGIDYRVRGISVEQGRLDLRVEPLGRHSRAGASDQS